MAAFEPLSFRASAPFTIGVEVEFQLLDPDTLNLIHRGPELLDNVDMSLSTFIKSEFIQSMVEVSTSVCHNTKEVADDLAFLCTTLESLADQCGCLPYAASLHPFARIKERRVSSSRRYQELMDELQLVGRRMMTQALHVHIGLADRHTAISVFDAIRSYLPIMLALTTSSPFLEEEDTGFHSYRTSLFGCLPRTGIPETLGSWQRFEQIIHILNQATILNGIKELWWDVRPHPSFGTIEIRICDLPSRFDEILAMVALVQSLVATLAANPSSTVTPQEIMNHNKWHAARYGLEGTCILGRTGTHVSFATAAADLLDFVALEARRLGNTAYLRPIEEILRKGTSAHRQKALFAKQRDLKSVVQGMREIFWQ